MSNESDSPFQEILSSEVVMMVCKSCGSEAPVNKVYLPYIKETGINKCRHCRNQDA
jgi:translation initiation factor 2 beta subunit (eIF-2beta)/eIF-5